MKSSVLRIGIGLLCAIAAVWSLDGSRGNAMKSTVFAADRPPIDRAIPVKLETATFALG